MGIAKSTAIVLVASAVAALARYAYEVSMAWLLPVGEFGVAGTAAAVALLLAVVVTGGFPQTVARLTAGMQAEGPRAAVMRQAFFGNIATGLMFGGVLFLFGAFALHLPPIYIQVLGLLWIHALLFSMGAVFKGGLQGQLRVYHLGTIDLIQIGTTFAVGVPLVLLGMGPLGAVLGLVAGSLATVAAGAVAYGNIGFLWIRGPLVNFATLSDTWFLWAGSLLIQAMLVADVVAVRLLSPAQDGHQFLVFGWTTEADALAGLYRAATLVGRLPIVLATVLGVVTFPYVARANASVASEFSVERLMKYAAIMLAPLSVAIVLLAKPISSLVFPGRFEGLGGLIVLVAAGTVFTAYAYLVMQVMQASGIAKRAAAALLPAFLIEVVLLGILVPRFGTNGAAWAAGIAGGLALSLLTLSYQRAQSTRLFVFDARLLLALGVFALLLHLLPWQERFGILLTLACSSLGYGFMLIAVRVLRHDDLASLPESIRNIARAVTPFADW